MRSLCSPAVDGVSICEMPLASGTSIQNCQPAGAGPQVGWGFHPGSGIQPGGGGGQFGGELYVLVMVPLPVQPRLRNKCAPVTYLCASPNSAISHTRRGYGMTRRCR